jgi:hypothetical protein
MIPPRVDTEGGVEPLLRASLRTLAEAFRQATVLRLDFEDPRYCRGYEGTHTIDWELIDAVARLEDALYSLVKRIDHLEAIERRILVTRSGQTEMSLPERPSTREQPSATEDMPF